MSGGGPGSGAADGPVHDLDGVPTGGTSGAIWTLAGSEDLNANLVRLGPGAGVGAHRNDEVDVLVYVRSGAGDVRIDGRAHALGAGSLVLIRRGTTRSIHAGAQGLTYLTVHRRRGPLQIRR